MFASKSQREIEIQGESVTIQKLSGSTLEKAREARKMAEIAEFRAMGGEMARAMFQSPEARALQAAKGPKVEPTTEEKRKARYASHDRTLVLTAGIKRMGADTLRADQIADLEEEPAQALHEAILDYSLPALDPAEAEAPKG